MKKILTLAAVGAASLLLAGCSLFGAKQTTTTDTTGTGETDLVLETIDLTKEKCLDSYLQWDEQKSVCEKLEPKSACLYTENQWDEQNQRCEFSKANCVAEGNQWNEQTASCEYSKEQCLAMGSQWDEQKAMCEQAPMTVSQKMEECLDNGDQRDNPTSTCQKASEADAAVSTEAKTYTMAEVGTHNSQASCWTVIKGEVYDVTAWIPQHPGGPQAILATCGKDGSDLFGSKHTGNEKAMSALAQFKIGALAK